MRRLSLRTLVLILLLPFASGCDALTGPGADRRIFVRPPAVLVIQNRDETALFSLAISPDVALLMDWGPCIVAPQCGYVAPGQELRLEPADITGASYGEDVLVYTWRAGMGPDDHMVPGPVSVKRVTLAARPQ